MTLDELPPSEERLRPLSRLENAFWILEQLAPASGVSNIELAFRTTAPLRWWPLQAAVNQLIARHPALRMRFPEVAGAPVRHLTAAADAGVAVTTREVPEDRLTEELQRFARAPFDLTREFPLRVGCFRTGGTSVVCLVLHHICTDVVSCRILVEELCRIHDAVAATREVPPALREAVPALERAEPSPAAVRYWLDHLSGADPESMSLRLAPGARSASSSFAGATYRRWLSDAGRAALSELRRHLRVTDNIILLSAFCLTLLRHGTGRDLLVGVPVGTRTPAQRTHVGLGVSTMPLRVRADPASGFAELVRRTRDAFLSGVEHSEASVEAVMTELGHRSADWRVPLFRHSYNHRAWDTGEVTMAGGPVEFLGLDDRSRLDLEFVSVPGPDGVLLRLTYATDVHAESEIAAFAERLDTLLQRAAEAPDAPLEGLDARSPADLALLADSARGECRPTEPPTLLAEVARLAEAEPDAPAVIEEGRVTTYGALVSWAAEVGDLLRTHGVRHGDVVALGLPRGVRAAVAVLGTWAAGAQFLPLDTGHPADRLRHQMADSGARVVLTDPAQAAPDWADGHAVLPVPDPRSERPAEFRCPESGDAAYVIYTSGSTGRPKGVRVSHQNLANVILDFVSRLGADSTTACLWATTPSFDISLLELLLPLAAGGRLVVADDAARLSPERFLSLLDTHDVSVVQATPTAWKTMVPEAGDRLAGRTLLCGGEPLPAALARRLLGLGCRLFNVYGPTETTIWSTAAEITEPVADPVPVGRPLTNTAVFLTDPEGRNVLPGAVGELCVAGDGVSEGYLGLPELTKERFGDHPEWRRYYRTGDLARLRPDGMFEVLGRLDRQVKLRGHRIELGEIEAVLHDHPEVTEAAVVTDGDLQGEDGRILAFVRPVAETDRARLVRRLWTHAQTRLPHYSMPGLFVLVTSFPTTGNGKMDHRALLALAEDTLPDLVPASGRGGGSGARPAPALTRPLLALWRERLGRPGLTADDNFFLNGGHSLLAMRIVPALSRLVGHEVTVQEVFAHPTAARLAAHLSPARENIDE
ncbi:amino acid adenylation domain-containing protein [Streptomyces sp. NPDC012616]|uniref:non-ribosomal peptide synthetase n=1 Tax=Streptomyces sp. NPDC012616 TaxID=3364840 RepID=UPI0036E911BE